jgi:hypothetical protein
MTKEERLAAYFVNQILLGKLTYQEVITAKPELQTAMDAYITVHCLTIDKTK